MALPDPLRARRLRLCEAGPPRGQALGRSDDPLRARDRPDRDPAQLAPGDDRDPLPAGDPPAPERDDRRLGAPAPDSRPDPHDARCRCGARWEHVGVRHAPARRAAAVAGGLVRRPSPALLRLGATGDVAAQHRARPADPRRAGLLVAGLRGAAAADLDGRAARLPRDRVHRLGVPVARVHLLGARVLRLLRARAAPLGAVRDEGSESGRDPDERRAADRVLRGALVLPAAAVERGRRGPAGSGEQMRRAALLLVALALLLPASARANGDPASDVLLTEQTFIPLEAPISGSAKSDLQKTVAEATSKGYPIRVALIAFTSDLGTAGSLWGKPQPYAKFLWNELSFQYPGRLLVAMPSGFGYYDNNKPVDREVALLKGVKPGTVPTDLAESAALAVRKLAAANGVKVAEPSGGGSSTRDRVLILVGALVALVVVLAFPAKLLRRRGRGGAQSPSSEPR